MKQLKDEKGCKYSDICKKRIKDTNNLYQLRFSSLSYPLNNQAIALLFQFKKNMVNKNPIRKISDRV